MADSAEKALIIDQLINGPESEWVTASSDDECALNADHDIARGESYKRVWGLPVCEDCVNQLEARR